MGTIGNKTVRVAGAAVAGVAAAVALTGCGLTGSGNGHVKAVSYATGTVGKTNQDAHLPGWVPDQAKSVTEVIRTSGSERILRYTSASAGLPAVCVPGKASKSAATLTADWWPHSQESRADRVCSGDWHVVVEGNAVYAFKPETVQQSYGG